MTDTERRIRSLISRPPGETVVQRREVSNAVQDRVHHTTAKEKGDRPRGIKQLPTYLEPAHYIEDAGKTVHATYTITRRNISQL